MQQYQNYWYWFILEMSILYWNKNISNFLQSILEERTTISIKKKNYIEIWKHTWLRQLQQIDLFKYNIHSLIELNIAIWWYFHPRTTN